MHFDILNIDSTIPKRWLEAKSLFNKLQLIEQLATIGIELLDERLLVPNQSALERGGMREHKLENAPLHRRLSMHVEQLQTQIDRLHAEHHVEFRNARDLKSARIDVASMETKIKPEIIFSIAEIVAFEAPRPTDRAEAPNERFDTPFYR